MKRDPTFEVEQIQAAAALISPHIRKTKLKKLTENLYIKAEHEQISGSFKVRGALNKVLSLSDEQLEQGIVCASAGNHGLGVALACASRNIECQVVVPENAPQVKVDAIRAQGAEVIFAQGGYGAAEVLGLQLADSRRSIWISPYNDKAIIQGQGTIGLEIAEELAEENVDTARLFIPMSGGGLLSGVGLVMKGLNINCRVIGVQTKAAPFLYEYLNRRSMDSVEELPTIADGLAGPVEAGSITLDILPKVTDEAMIIGEAEIRFALRWLFENGEIVEPSAAVAVAAARSSEFDGTKVAIVSGGNIDKQLLEGILREATL